MAESMPDAASPPLAALVMHPDCGRHDTGWGHPEHQGRLPAIVQAIYRATPALIERLDQRQADPVGPDELRRVHADRQIARVRRACARAGEVGRPVHIEADTAVSGASWDAALAAVGTAVEAVRIVADGEARTAFALTRPPGHHATADRSMGFCLFNNVAVAARWLQQERGLERILILDWDVHHGNGTQSIFYDDASVYYLSLHIDGHYPASGAADERGDGAGVGATLNVPLEAGASADAYRRAFSSALDAAFGEFEPEFVIVSAGFDCLADDPLGGLELEPADLHAMTAEVMSRARDAAGGRVALALEGGYAPKRVGEGVVSVLRALTGLDPAD